MTGPPGAGVEEASAAESRLQRKKEMVTSKSLLLPIFSSLLYLR